MNENLSLHGVERMFTSLELCAGAGGQALGLERAGFKHVALVEIEPVACATLRLNRPDWHVIQGDVRSFDARPFVGVDLVAAGVPCPPFSKAGKQLGPEDDRDLFPTALRIIGECRPRAVMLENVRGLLDPMFGEYRAHLECQLSRLGYHSQWKLLQSSEFGVSQLRPRVVLVAIREALNVTFHWPQPSISQPPSIGDLLYDLMAANGWPGAREWQERATSIAPTLVGGSKKHGGPDLGPTRARQTWATLGVDGSGVWDDAPPQSFVGAPRLTTKMAARVQGFPDEWDFMGGKTAVYRQIGNAFPPPVAFAVGRQIRMSLEQAVLGVQPALL